MAIDKVVDSTQLDTDLTSVANAIRTKGGTSASLTFPTGFVSAVEAIETGGGEPTITELISNSVVSYSNNSHTGDVQAYLFQGKTALQSVAFTALAGKINDYAFSECTNLTEAVFPLATSVGSRAFQNCAKIGSLQLPKVATLTGDYNFGGVGRSATPATIVLPSISEQIPADCFRSTIGYFSAIDLGPSLTKLMNRAIYQCTVENLILRSPSVVALNSTNSVGVGTVGGLTGISIVWVPSTLLSEYEAATNWADAKASSGHQFAFRAIEGSIYENAYADGTPIT